MLTIQSAAKLAGVNEKTVRRWVKAGKVDHLRIGRRIYTTERALDVFAQYSTAQSQYRRTDRAANVAAELNKLLEGEKPCTK